MELLQRNIDKRDDDTWAAQATAAHSPSSPKALLNFLRKAFTVYDQAHPVG